MTMYVKFQFLVRLGFMALFVLAVLTLHQRSGLAACGVDFGSMVGALPEEIVNELVRDQSDAQQKSCKPAALPTKKQPKAQQKVDLSQIGRGAQAIEGDFIADEVLVTVSGDAGVAEDIAAEFGLNVRSITPLSVLGASLVRFGIPDGRLVAVVRGQLGANKNILSATANHIYQLNGKVKGILRYSLKAAGVEGLRETAKGRGVKIAIIDGEVDADHPALKNAIRARYDALKDVPVISKAHGTAVALLAAGSAPFAGAAPEAELYVARAFDVNKTGAVINSAHAVLMSLDWAFRQNVNIINMSFAGAQNALISQALANLARVNVILVGAAGNNGLHAPFAFPAASPDVFAVTATDAKNRIYAKANRGAYIFVAAPGVDVMVTEGEDKLRFKSGTSFGAALFSGIAALLLERYPNISLEEFRRIIEASAKDLGKPGRDKTYGVGLVRAGEMLRRAAKK